MSAKSDDNEMSASDSSKVVTGPKATKGGKSKRKTEPANPFGQFLREKHAHDGKVVHLLACEEWRNMSEESKEFYRKLYEEEKTAMGDTYRAKEIREGNSETKEKSPGKKKGVKVNQFTKDPLNSLQLLSKIQSLDNETDMTHLEARHLQEFLCSEKVQLATSQLRLEEKIRECESVKEKYKTLLSQHSSCQDKQ